MSRGVTYILESAGSCPIFLSQVAEESFRYSVSLTRCLRCLAFAAARHRERCTKCTILGNALGERMRKRPDAVTRSQKCKKKCNDEFSYAARTKGDCEATVSAFNVRFSFYSFLSLSIQRILFSHFNEHHRLRFSLSFSPRCSPPSRQSISPLATKR